MSEAMDRQLAAYRRLHPQIVAQNKPGWALVVREKLIRVFDEFDEAAMYADKQFPSEQVLIRHTSEQRGMAPFIVPSR